MKRRARTLQVGHPDYEVTGGIATYKGEDLLDLEPEDRARAGLFMSFQSPVEVPGVSNTDFLRAACNARRKAMGQPELVRMAATVLLLLSANAPSSSCFPALGRTSALEPQLLLSYRTRWSSTAS